MENPRKGHIPPNKIDMVGKTYNFLTVIEDIGNRKIRCRCVCGKEITSFRTNVLNNKSKSCNCQGRGIAKKRTIRAWSLMKYRCNTPTSSDYPNYGGRGVKVCERWQESFINFFEDMGDCEDNLTLDRIDVNGDYEPSNCRWADMETQMNNRRNNRYVTYNGEKTTIAVLARKTKMGKGTLTRRLDMGMTAEQAIITPINTAFYSKALKDKYGISK